MSLENMGMFKSAIEQSKNRNSLPESVLSQMAA